MIMPVRKAKTKIKEHKSKSKLLFWYMLRSRK